MLRTPNYFYMVFSRNSQFGLMRCTGIGKCSTSPISEHKLEKESPKAFNFYKAHRDDAPSMAERMEKMDILSEMFRPVVQYGTEETKGMYGEATPEWITEKIPKQRMDQLMKGEMGKATLAEVVNYFYQLSLAQPLNRDYAQVYLWAAHELTEQHAGRKILPTEKPKLNMYQVQLFEDLRRWLWRKSAGRVQEKLYDFE